jgi:hypothetical protein
LIFRWDTLTDLGLRELKYQHRSVLGHAFEITLTNGQKTHVWRAEDGMEYFCHGLTFGGKDAPGGSVSPFNEFVPVILEGYFDPIAESEAVAGDILVWRGVDANDVIHSAILTDLVVTPGKSYLDYST